MAGNTGQHVLVLNITHRYYRSTAHLVGGLRHVRGCRRSTLDELSPDDSFESLDVDGDGHRAGCSFGVLRPNARPNELWR